MTRAYTTQGCFIQPSVDADYFTGPSISKEEQESRLIALRAVKGMSQKKQREIGESVFKK